MPGPERASARTQAQAKRNALIATSVIEAMPRRGAGSLAPRRPDRVRALDRLSAQGLPGESRGRVAACNSRLLRPEVENHITAPVSVDVLGRRLRGHRLGSRDTEPDGARVQ